MLSKFDYIRPKTLTEALNYLAKNASTKILAGGTDLMVLLRRNALTPEHILDIKGIPETNKLEYKKNSFFILIYVIYNSKLEYCKKNEFRIS